MSSRYLPQKEDKVPHCVDGGHSQRVLHQDDESVACRGAEAGAVDCGCGVSVLKKRAAAGERFASVPIVRFHLTEPKTLT